MLSLYVHIPFCSTVCSYCSFSVLEKQSEETIQAYLTKLHEEIDHYGSLFPKAPIKSLYF
jgi:coproporphyrinogen III oxidase-like Fe-S oxidoreductase